MENIRHYLTKLFLQKDCFEDIFGQAIAKMQLKSALITGRHVLIFGPPGIGKTTLAKSVAKLIPKRDDTHDTFIRVQGSPDLTVEDLIGDIDPVKALEFGPLSKEAFVPGKIFKANEGVLFFDEVNRCSEKLQNALLQALEEGIATIGSYDVDLPANFIFIGTLNPQDSSTEKLSEAFLDRFDIVEMTYPETSAIERRIILAKGEKLAVKFPEDLITHIVEFVRQLRDKTRLSKLPSVRATIGLYERSQAHAILQRKDVVDMEDIAHAIISVLSHRIELKPSLRYAQNPQDYVKQQFEQYLKAEQIPLPASLEESSLQQGDDT